MFVKNSKQIDGGTTLRITLSEGLEMHFSYRKLNPGGTIMLFWAVHVVPASFFFVFWVVPRAWLAWPHIFQFIFNSRRRAGIILNYYFWDLRGENKGKQPKNTHAACSKLGTPHRSRRRSIFSQWG